MKYHRPYKDQVEDAMTIPLDELISSARERACGDIETIEVLHRLREYADLFASVVEANLHRFPDGWAVTEEAFENGRRVFSQRMFRDKDYVDARGSACAAATFVKAAKAANQ